MEVLMDRFVGEGGVDLAWRGWRPEDGCSAVVVIVHGIGDHCGRYADVAGSLCDRGFAVYSWDQRGHGASPGQRGHISAWSDYLGDLHRFLALVVARESGRPVFLWGHSLGALEILDHAGSSGGSGAVAGLIVSGGPFQPAGVKEGFKVALARVLSGCCPRFPIRLAVHSSALILDPVAREKFEGDRLVHRWVTARWGTEILAAIDRVNAAAGEMKLPILLLHGGEDPINAVAGSEEYLSRLRSSDKTLRVYPGAGHDPHRDRMRDRVIDDIASWLGERTTPGQG